MIKSDFLLSEIALENGERACGKARTSDSIYLENPTSPFGEPIESFYVDLPIPLNPESINLTPIGVQLIQDESTGVYHIFDWIGEKHYPSPADFLEEARLMGISRKLSPSLDYTKLTAASLLICVHPRAVIISPELYTPTAWQCPTSKNHEHNEPCIGWHWHECFNQVDFTDEATGKMWRIQPSGQYELKPSYPRHTTQTACGIFARVPISRLVVTARDDNSFDSAKLERISKSSGIEIAQVYA
jgi:hypothetical protein